ncbi:MAG: 50S ribosomal protein L18Ae [Candidatus Micrarchaeia archaeon]
MAMFTVSGKIVLGREERPFSKKVEAQSENAAKQKTYALFGSVNGVKRNKVSIDKVEKG